MSEDEARELWAAIEKLRCAEADTQGAMREGFAEIKSMLSERCEARLDRVRSLETKTTDHGKRLDQLEQFRAKVLVWSGIGSIVGGGIVALLVRLIAG